MRLTWRSLSWSEEPAGIKAISGKAKNSKDGGEESWLGHGAVGKEGQRLLWIQAQLTYSADADLNKQVYLESNGAVSIPHPQIAHWGDALLDLLDML